MVMKFSREAQMEQRALWDKSVAEYTQKLKAAGIEFINTDTKPFYDATAPVRAKYGAQFAGPDAAHQRRQVRLPATPGRLHPAGGFFGRNRHEPSRRPRRWTRCTSPASGSPASPSLVMCVVIPMRRVRALRVRLRRAVAGAHRDPDDGGVHLLRRGRGLPRRRAHRGADAHRPRAAGGAARLRLVRARVRCCWSAASCVIWGAKLVQGMMGQTISELPWLPVGVTYLAAAAGQPAHASCSCWSTWCSARSTRRPICTFDHEAGVAEEAI